MEDDKNLIEVPDTDELLRIAQEVGQGTTDFSNDSGDLSPSEFNTEESDDPLAGRAPERRTPIRGHVNYLSLGIPMDIYLAFSAYDEQMIRLESPNWMQTSESDRMVMWIQSMVGRDLAVDEQRATDERLYWWGGLFRGISYRNLVMDTHMKGYDAKLKQQLKLLRTQQYERVRLQLGPEWTDEAVEELLGPMGAHDE